MGCGVTFFVYLRIQFTHISVSFMNLYIGNLDYGVTNDMLRDFFEAVGEVSSAKVITDKETGRSRGFAFVEMPNDDEAQKALDTLNGSNLGKRQISVTEARPKPEGNNNRFSNNNRNNRNRY